MLPKVPTRLFPDGRYATLYCNFHNYLKMDKESGGNAFVQCETFFFLVRQIAYEFGGTYGNTCNTGIWAYFPSSEKALEAGMELHRCLEMAYQKSPDLPRIQPTVNADIGMLSFATLPGGVELELGSPFRISREIGTLLNDYGLGILMTESFRASLSDSFQEEVEYWWVDQILTDDEKVERVYEVYTLEPQSLRAFKRRSEWMLREALDCYFSRNVPQALAHFEALLQEGNAQVKTVPLLERYRNRCRDFLDPKRFPPYDIMEHWELAGGITE